MNDETKLLFSHLLAITKQLQEKKPELLASDPSQFIESFARLVRSSEELNQLVAELLPKAEHLHKHQVNTEKALRQSLLKRIK